MCVLKNAKSQNWATETSHFTNKLNANVLQKNPLVIAIMKWSLHQQNISCVSHRNTPNT